MHNILKSGEATSVFSPSGKTPIVEGFGFSGSPFTVLGYGISYKLSLDAFLGYEAPLSYYNSGGNNILFTPKGYVEAATHNYIQINSPVFSFRFNFDFVGFRYDFV